MIFSVLFPQQPRSAAAIEPFARAVIDLGLARLWTGQSFNIESHIALASLAGAGLSVPVGIGTALAALRTPYDAALQARSLAAVLDQEVSLAYGVADPGFVTSVKGAPLLKPASYVGEYIRLVRGLLDGQTMSSSFDGLAMSSAMLPPFETAVVKVGAGVLRPGMAVRSMPNSDFVLTWMTPKEYVHSQLVPKLEREDGTFPRVITNVHCAVARPGRNPNMLAQVGCGNHLTRHHYVDMLQRSGLDIDISDPASGARELVRNGIFVYGSPAHIADELKTFGAFGIDEVVLNTTAVSSLYGDDQAIEDIGDIVQYL